MAALKQFHQTPDPNPHFPFYRGFQAVEGISIGRSVENVITLQPAPPPKFWGSKASSASLAVQPYGKIAYRRDIETNYHNSLPELSDYIFFREGRKTENIEPKLIEPKQYPELKYERTEASKPYDYYPGAQIYPLLR